MENLKELSNQEIIEKIKHIVENYESQKLKVVSEYDKLIKMEQDIIILQDIITERVKIN
jgi:hypothetical protein